MKFSTFELVSVKNWCDETQEVSHMVPPIKKNIMYRHIDSEVYAIEKPDFYADNSDIEDMEESASRFGYKKGENGFEISDVFLAYLENVNIQQNESSMLPIFLSRNIALAESVYNEFTWNLFFSAGNYLDHKVFNQINISLSNNQILPVKIHLDCEPDNFINEPCVLLGNSNNYCHWITESVSRMWCFEVFPELSDLPLILPGRPKAFIFEILEALNLSKNKFIYLDGNMINAKKLYFPSYLACGFSKRETDWVRDKLLTAFSVCRPPKGTKRYFVSRDDANLRRVINEDEIIKYLGKHDFQTICPGRMSVRQQIETFSEAEIVVAPHGAGNTNFMFAPKRAILIELVPRSNKHLAFWMMTKLTGQLYGRLVCYESKAKNMIVDVEKLDIIIRKALKEI